MAEREPDPEQLYGGTATATPAPPKPAVPGERSTLQRLLERYEKGTEAREQLYKQYLPGITEAQQAAARARVGVVAPALETLKAAAGAEAEAARQPLPQPEPSPPTPSLRPRPFLDVESRNSLQGVIQGLGLIGQVFAGIGYGTPVGALNAMSGAMHGWAQGDAVRAERDWKQFLAETDRIRYENRHALEMADRSLRRFGTNREAAQAALVSALGQADLADHAAAAARMPFDEYLKALDEIDRRGDKLFDDLFKLESLRVTSELKWLFLQDRIRHEKVMEGDLGDLGGAAVTTLDQVPAKYRTVVDQLIHYRIPLPTGFALRSPYWQAVLSYAGQVDPSFDATQYNVRLKTRQDFATGKAAVNIRSLNTAVGHLDTLRDRAEKLENADVRFWNIAKNYSLTATGDARVVEFEAAANAVESELAALFKGTGATDQEIKAWRSSLNSSMSPEQLRGAMITVTELVLSRLEALRDQYEKGTGTAPDFQILTSKSRDILKKLGIKTLDESRSGPPKRKVIVGPDGTRYDGSNVTAVRPPYQLIEE